MEKKRRKVIGSEISLKSSTHFAKLYLLVNGNMVIIRKHEIGHERYLSEGRAIIANVYRFLKEEYEFTMLHKEPNCDLSHLRNIQQRTADATGVCLTTVQRILKEERLSSTSSDSTSLMKNRRRKANKKENKTGIEIEPKLEIKTEDNNDFERT